MPTADSSSRPLTGRRIVVTRSREQASELRAKLEAKGATVLEIPLINVTADATASSRDDIFSEISTYEWMVFTSPNGVRFFFEEFFRRFRDIRAIGGARLAAVGPATAHELRALHLEVDIVPKEHHAQALIEALKAEQSLENVKLLVVTGNLNSDVVTRDLEIAQAIVDQFAVYKTEPSNLSLHSAADDFRAHGADAIIFASSSAAQSFVQQAATLALKPGATRPLTVSIGPQTSDAMRTSGIPLDLQAQEATLDSIVEALVKRFAK